ncbi:MAG: arsenite methyltransferase [Actinomycetota bacterium]
MDGDLKEQVRRRYAGVALAVGEAGCCGSSGSGVRASGAGEACGGYSEVERRELPRAAVEASLGCGNPVALAELTPGEVVLDLGSGGGIDVLLSARRVSPGGRAYGLDMTDEMLELARRSAREAGAENVEFIKGEIESVPLPDASVDVVISNCVINLSTDKRRVLKEAFRVLRPGGRLAVYDVVFLGEKSRLPEEALHAVELWTGCIAGALEKGEYEALLADAGFIRVSVEPTHIHDPAVIPGLRGHGVGALREVLVASAFVRARKPEVL